MSVKIMIGNLFLKNISTLRNEQLTKKLSDNPLKFPANQQSLKKKIKTIYLCIYMNKSTKENNKVFIILK